MDQIHVKVVEPELREGLIEGFLDVFRGMEWACELRQNATSASMMENELVPRTLDVTQTSSRGTPLSLKA